MSEIPKDADEKPAELEPQRASKWTTTLPLVGIIISLATATITYIIFHEARENIELIRSGKRPVINVVADGDKLAMIVEYPLTVSNWSTAPVVLVSLACESGRRTNPRDSAVHIRFLNGCKILQEDKTGRITVSEHLDIGAKQAADLVLVSKYFAPEAVEKRYREYKKSHPKFDDEAFLLSLALTGSDFFGNELGPPYHYLQQTFADRSCVGGSILFTGRSQNTKLSFNVDYYVGRFLPVANCEGPTQNVTIYSSTEYRTPWAIRPNDPP
jgi:hypothetical protein